MRHLTPEGQEIVDDLAERHGFSRDAILHLLCALRQGNGRMAMFSHPEFGGPGQWMYGGPPMLSDVLNPDLRCRVDTLCHELSEKLAGQPAWLGNAQGQAPASDDALAWATADTPWWPAELGTPSATGSQDGLRYAYFAEARRLVVQRGDETSIHDTGEHRITGISTSQQGAASSVIFTSQHGQVDLASLPVISSAPADHTSVTASATRREGSPHRASQESELLNAIERLGELRDKGILTEEEFAAKKAELLSRL